ncbi:MAG: glycosyltransferase family 1 protein, partial [Myxococcota bacterium]
ATHAVGDTGYVVPIKDATALAHGLRAALTLSSAERRRRGEAARQRVVARYSAARQAARFRELYGRTSSTGARRE